MPATMKDVAKEAGVALGTVSKVINNISVGEEYKIKVERAIKYKLLELIEPHENIESACLRLLEENMSNGKLMIDLYIET